MREAKQRRYVLPKNPVFWFALLVWLPPAFVFNVPVNVLFPPKKPDPNDQFGPTIYSSDAGFPVTYGTRFSDSWSNSIVWELNYVSFIFNVFALVAALWSIYYLFTECWIRLTLRSFLLLQASVVVLLALLKLNPNSQNGILKTLYFLPVILAVLHAAVSSIRKWRLATQPASL